MPEVNPVRPIDQLPPDDPRAIEIWIIRETKKDREYPMYYTGSRLDPHSGRIVSEGWSSHPDGAKTMLRDWAEYTAAHFNRRAWLDETGYTYDLVLLKDAKTAFRQEVAKAIAEGIAILRQDGINPVTSADGMPT